MIQPGVTAGEIKVGIAITYPGMFPEIRAGSMAGESIGGLLRNVPLNRSD
ncbi:hypothetical protein D3OALGA1CA_2228 [Olavius algarvensis associated proteobacterium Delta 3]|nr:hypothetical protein D3OALGA1CA_2228 [Olavius algarvensis associated proteobacterium Delta 3]CAB5165906.1 hypothetical protein D3OALGB2SA_5755 [Olavius algarvensis associated proteobacterium Delta 3]